MAPSIFALSGDAARPIVESASDPRNPQDQEDQVLPVEATELDLRMVVQQSTFTLHGARKPLEDMASNSTFLARARIPPGSTDNMRKGLADIGLRERDLFPDLAHLAKSVTEYGRQLVEMDKQAKQL